MFESDLIKNHKVLVASDEVGRGPLAGPVIAGAVKININKGLKNVVLKLIELGVTDSKKLTDKKRKKILNDLNINYSKGNSWVVEILNEKIELNVVIFDAKKIDKINILQASLQAMKKASYSLEKDMSSLFLVDGNKSFDNDNENVIPVVKGDSKSALIGLASIIAKVYRDELMFKYSKKYPHYDFEKNAGYPTKKHREAIELYGITPIHRKTFKGVKEYVETIQ